MKIGYQGTVGSHNEYATMKFIEKLHLSDSELVPLITSENVINKLINCEIDYGIVAVHNSIAGAVLESIEAMRSKKLETVACIVLPIHQFLFIKKELTDISEIKFVASHVQALKQTGNNLSLILGSKFESIIVENTAIAAKRLAEGTLSDDTAVICSKKAGETYGLFLYKENIEDCPNNKTKFVLLKNLR